MKIAYTYHGISLNKIGGVSRYFYEIISRISTSNETSILSKYSRNLYFKDIIGLKEFMGNIDFKGKSRLEKYFYEFHLKKQLKNNSFDIIHHTGENPNIYDFCNNTPVIITIHDFVPEIFNYQPDRIKLRRSLIEKASGIICVSNKTKEDLFKFNPDIDKSKVFVIYHGYDPAPPVYKTNPYDNYILYVGARSSYKNFNTFLKAVAPILYGEDTKLVCTGRKFTDQEIDFISSLEITEKVINAGFVSDPELDSLYKHALCFVYPSEYEGFGIPILEAYRNECPVCLSDASCFPEIAGDAAIYFDPKNTGSITQAIQKLLSNNDLRTNLIKRGTKRLSDFSWEKAALSTLDVYDQVLRKS